MKGWVLAGWMMFVLLQATAQEPLVVTDSIAEQVESELLAGDSLSDPVLFALPQPYEFIPAEETPELVADRLSCLQKTIPLTYTSNVHGFINFFTIRNRDYTRLMLRRKDLYFPLFEKHLSQHNLPEELKYLSIIESGLNPRAVSRASAVGLWQFMSFTGRYFGLHNDGYVDDRMDPDKSTEAACKYLKQLHTIFGNWELALAAYNSGPGTVKRAIRRSGYKKTFWEIYRYLPRETRSYVPQYVAIIYAMNYAEEHNMSNLAPEEIMPHDTISVHQYIHLETFASLTGTCVEELHALNPSLRRNAIPQTAKPFILKMPLAAKVQLSSNRTGILDSSSRVGRKEAEALALTPGNTAGREPIVYKVRNGDALGLIAQRFHVRISDIREWNKLKGNMIRTGQKLTLWVRPSQKNQASALTPANNTYTVQQGDTLWDISRKFKGVSVEKLKALNNLKSDQVSPGMKLVLG
ncbi:MAG: LysM peptidoglycan-binding domain-containing protein [Cyclobacteriaceae bacterium]|nr:LysM peptidoglycan-binding domain-containing protein [Cyclobacteriaceae bacterium]